MSVRYLLIAVSFLFVFFSCKNEVKKVEVTEAVMPEYNFDGLQEKAQKLFGSLPLVAETADNEITEGKLALGKMLYFDNRLSKDNTQSCNTCHNVATYGVDNNSFSAGNDGGMGGRNSPTTFNAALHLAQFWDGREPTVEAQAGGPILNPIEMAMPSEEAVVEKLSKIEDYVSLFATAFPDDKEPLNYNNLKQAIGVYERKLITPSKFDEYLGGNEMALNDDEKVGLQTFIKSGCVTCHAGNLLGGTMYQKFGLMGGDYWELTGSENIDEGRFEVTGEESDKYVFKVPSLRNIEKTYPYFHDGSVNDLKEAVLIMAKLQVPIPITEQEAEEIVTFLNTLTGEVPAELAAAPENI